MFVLCGCVIVTSLVRSITITVHITPALHSITCSLKPPDADPREGEDGADIDRWPNINIMVKCKMTGKMKIRLIRMKQRTIIKEVTSTAY